MLNDPNTPPEPQPLLEYGVTTSEWRLVVIYLKQLAAAGTAAAIAYATARVGLHLDVSPQVLDVLVQLEVAGAVAVVGYAVSRGVRKSGALRSPAVVPTPAPISSPPAPAAGDAHPGAGKPATEVLGPTTAPAAAAINGLTTAAPVAPGGIIPNPPAS